MKLHYLPNWTVAVIAAIGALDGLVGGSYLGVFLAEYAPFFGGFLKEMAEPWSPYRNAALLQHMMAFGGIGMAVLTPATVALAWIIDRQVYQHDLRS